MEQTILGLGGFFTLIYLIIGYRRSRRGDNKVRFGEILLLLVSIVLLIATLTLNNANNPAFNQIEIVILIIALILGLLGLREMFMNSRPLMSRGLLTLGAGIILIIASFGIPTYAQNHPHTDSIALSIPGSAGDSNLPGGFPQALTNFAGNNQSANTVKYPIQANMMLVMPTPAGTAQTIPTLSEPQVFFMTPTSTPEVMDICEAVVTTNLNLRSLPRTVGDILTVIKADTSVLLIAQNDDSSWYYMQSDLVEGWLFGDLLTLDDSCSRIPVRGWQ